MVSFGVVPGMIMVQLLGIGLDLSPGFNWTPLGFTHNGIFVHPVGYI